jgi:hypothetical protein
MRLLAAISLSGAILAASCASWLRDGLDPTTMPETVRPDYALFAERCSKCHSLARPLTSGIDEDSYWVSYVARMRRQPASGISEEDTVVILRFLHYFSIEEKRKHGKLPPEVAVEVHSPAPTVVVVVPTATPAPPPPPPSASPVAPTPPEAKGPR